MNYFIMFLLGLLGILLFTLRKVYAINKRTPSLDYSGVFKMYWKSEWAGILFSVAFLTAFIAVSSEYLNIPKDETTPLGPYTYLVWKLAKFIKTVCIAVGYFALSFGDLLFGITEKKIAKKVATAEQELTSSVNANQN